jgi:hypothetical protein
MKVFFSGGLPKSGLKNLLNKETIMYIETNFKWFYDYFYKI